MKKILIIFVPLSVLFYGYLFFYFHSDFDKKIDNEYGVVEYSSQEERHATYENFLNKAISEHNPSFCAELPVDGRFYDEFGGDHQWGTWNVFEMRKACLRAYVDTHQDLEGCIIMEKTLDKIPEHYESSGCIMHIAEITNNQSLCDLAKNLDVVAECHALLNKDINFCYKISKDDYDTSKYSRAVGSCIADVVAFGSKDYTSCLKIDGPDYGKQWWYQRNECLVKAAYFMKKDKKDFTAICDSMISDIPTSSPDKGLYQNEKEDCHKGVVTYNIPPIRNW